MHGLCRGIPNHGLGGAQRWLPSPGPTPQCVFLEPSQPWSRIPNSNTHQTLSTWEAAGRACWPLPAPPAEKLRRDTYPKAEDDLVSLLQKHKSQEMTHSCQGRLPDKRGTLLSLNSRWEETALWEVGTARAKAWRCRSTNCAQGMATVR